MKNCYDSLDNNFVCQLQKIKCLFADKVFSEYKSVRFGIVPCKNLYSVTQLSDLKELMEYNESLDISLYTSNTYRNNLLVDPSLLEMSKTGCIPEFSVETQKVCNISNLVEKINTL